MLGGGADLNGLWLTPGGQGKAEGSGRGREMDLTVEKKFPSGAFYSLSPT